MKLTRALLLMVAALLSLTAVGAAPASATTVTDCQSQLATLRADTVTAQGSFATQKDFANQIAKLDTASDKLAEDKNADAVQKLVDFQTRLTELATAPKPKVDPAVAQALITEAQRVIDCINAIETPSP